MNVYDTMAHDFDRHRSLPDGVAEAVRDTVLRAVLPPRPCVLDLGAGSGQIGRSFVRAGDDYIGADLSLGMLRQFASQVQADSLLQANGALLPFRDATFDAILLMRVLSSVEDWRSLLREVLRVLRTDGVLMIGRVVASDDGIDARLKSRLAAILDEMDIHPYRDKLRGDALAWLAQEMPNPTVLDIASWTELRRPQAFLERHARGARFAVLPLPVRQDAMRRLTEWAVETFGSLEAGFPEQRRLELTMHRLRKEPLDVHHS